MDSAVSCWYWLVEKNSLLIYIIDPSSVKQVVL